MSARLGTEDKQSGIVTALQMTATAHHHDSNPR